MTSIPVGLTPVSLLPRNEARMTFTVRNTSPAAEKIYFSLAEPQGLSIGISEYVLDPGEEKSFILFFDGDDVRLPVSAISDTATGTVQVAETSWRGQAYPYKVG